MKKFLFALAVLSVTIFTVGCHSDVKNPPKSDPIEQETPTTPEPEYEDLGEVDKISFTVSDYPDNTNLVLIYRKKASNTDWNLYSNVWVQTDLDSFEYKDPFVNPNSTYNYKCKFSGNTGFTRDELIIMNNETSNFTPSSGLGEITVQKPYPEISISAGKYLNFSEPVKVIPELNYTDFSQITENSENELCSHIYNIYVSNCFSTYKTPFNNSTIDLSNHYANFIYPNVDKILTGIIPGYVIRYTINENTSYDVDYLSTINIMDGQSITY